LHLIGQTDTWDAFPPGRHFDDTADRHDAYRAIAVSAGGLAATGLVELAIALVTGSVGLLGDAPAQPVRCVHLGGGVHRF
jgi:hypothetical protein